MTDCVGRAQYEVFGDKKGRKDKKGDNAVNKVSVPIASDSFTGCSLQLIGNYYSGENLKAPFVYAIMERRTGIS